LCSHTKGIKSRPFSEFHYSFENLKEAKVFLYEKNDSMHTAIYRMQQVVETGEKRYMINVLLGNTGIRDSSVYEINEDKITLKDIYIIHPDRNTSSNKIYIGRTFGRIENDKVLAYTVRFNEPNDMITIESRSELDSTFSSEIFDKEVDCIRSKDTLTLSIVYPGNEKMNDLVSMTGKSIYAYGFGLVYYSRFFYKDNSFSEFRLKKIIPLEEYLKK
jgi:hypothetical protein